MTYQEAIEALRAAQPGHVLLRLLSLKETPANRLVLDRELRKIARPAAAPTPIGAVAAVRVVEIEQEDQPDDTDDDVLTRLRMQQSDLFGDRRKLSNSLHDCANDAQRAKVSREIQSVQRRIEWVRKQIQDYKAYGYVPGQDEKYPVPDDPFVLTNLRDSLRASLSRKKKEIRLLGADVLDEVPGAAEKLQKAETKFTELQNHLTRVQKAIEDRNIQPGRLQEG
ncbi:MAG TPA: hypothetical protein PK228_01420 [Saprospiraceae bacterium]|nr:hypothetical protein [Saprospiraceae bacterium]